MRTQLTDLRKRCSLKSSGGMDPQQQNNCHHLGSTENSKLPAHSLPASRDPVPYSQDTNALPKVEDDARADAPCLRRAWKPDFPNPAERPSSIEVCLAGPVVGTACQRQTGIRCEAAPERGGPTTGHHVANISTGGAVCPDGPLPTVSANASAAGQPSVTKGRAAADHGASACGAAATAAPGSSERELRLASWLAAARAEAARAAEELASAREEASHLRFLLDGAVPRVRLDAARDAIRDLQVRWRSSNELLPTLPLSNLPS